MKITLRFAVFLLTWTALGRTVAWAQCQPSYLDNSTSSSGLTAEYYRTTFYQEAGFNANAITFFQRTAPQRRNDQTVNFGTSTFPVTVFSAGSATNPDNFSARYRGSINIPVTGNYTFYLTSDDASYMWIDAPALATIPNATNASISNGGPHSASERSFTVTLTAGFHDVLILYAEEGGENSLKLEYANAAAGIARQVVPASALCAGPASANNAPTASNITNTAVPISSATATLSPNLSGTDADGTLAYYNVLTLPAAAAGVLRFNNTAVIAGQAIPSGQLNLLTFTPTTGYTGNAVFTYTATDNAGRTAQTAATYTIPVSSTISGVVFEDVNYGGGAGRPSTASGAVGRPNATVELYNSAGALVGTTTTDATGKYTFNVPNGTYTIRVVNSTVSSSRTGYTTALIPVQTYNGTTTRVGGENPLYTDAAANSGTQSLAALSSGTTTPESIATITSSGGVTAGPDFGFNFDLIVNNNNGGQGSLRQFILNANTLGNEASLAQSGSYVNAGTITALPANKETSIFMIPSGQAVPGLLASTNNGPASQLTNGVAVISPTTVLPNITGTNTNLDGTTQTANIGNTNAAVLGTGGTVGTAGTALSTVNGPEVQLVGTRSFDGLVVAGASTTIRGLSLYRFDHNITVNDDITNFLIEQNVVGTSATSFTDPGVGVRTLNEGILLNDADNGTVRNNLIGYNGGMGVWVQGLNNGSNNNTISGNEIRGNAQETKPAPEGLVFDGLELQGSSTGNTVSGNLITDTNGHGIDSYFNAIGGNTITGNTISNNGVAVPSNAGEEGSGLRIFGATNPTIISNNILSGNRGSGVLVAGSANTIRISQNSTFGNTRLGIDLLTTAENNAPTFYNGATGTATNVTINDSGDGDTGGNGVLNFPVITSATVQGNSLIVQGYARPGSLIEFFTAAGTANSVATNVGFGQGQTYLGSYTEGSSADTNIGTGTYSGTINGLTQGTDNTNQFTFTIPLTGNFASVAAGSVLTSTATLNNSTSEFSGNVTTQSVALTGYVFEDVNYGGGAGRPRTTAGTATRSNARVELYDNTGTFVAATTTDANGQYSFNAAAGTYTVRVVNSTVTSSRTGYVAGLLPVQTYNGATNYVGGEAPEKVDAAAGTTGTTLASLSTATTIAESQATVTVGNLSNTTGPDFGFNFDVVTNTNDAGQGSLRQFITNANALKNTDLAQVGQTAGVEASIFMIPNGAASNAPAGLRNGLISGLTNGVAVITPASVLPQLTDSFTSIDGTLQSTNIGNSNTAVLGAGGTVGTANNSLSQVNGPEVQIVGSATRAIGLDVTSTATNANIKGLAIYGFGNGNDNDNNANIRISANSVTLSQNVIGSAATSFAAPSVATGADNIRVTGGTGVQIINNLIGFANGKGIAVNNGVANTTITNNEIRSNSRTATNLDGMDLQGLSAVVTNNLIINNSGNGIDSYNGGGQNTISGNTITGNGVGNGETAAIRLYNAGSTVSGNVINANYGAGIMGTAGSNNNTFSQNSIYANGTITGNNNAAASNQIGIDLLSSTNDEAKGTSPYVTLNDNNGTTNDTDAGGNGLLNFPVIQSATLRNGTLYLNGYATPGSTIEFFIAAADGSSFGEGQTYLFTRTEGATNDLNAGKGSYSGTINGINQGAEVNQNAFAFAIPLSSLTPAQQGALSASNVLLTSTATVTGTGTSEFSGNAPVLQSLTANNDLATTNVGTAVTFSVTGNDTPLASIDATTIDLDPNTAGIQTSYTVTGQGTFTTAGVAAGQVKFTPANNIFTGVVTIPYVVSNTSGIASNQANLSVTIKPALDLATTITAPSNNSTIAAGASVNYSVSYTNSSSFDANNVSETLQLPAGLTSNGGTVTFTGAPSGAAYDNNTGVVTFTPTAVTLAAGTTVSYGVSVSKVPANGSLTATSTIGSTGNSAEPNMSNNVAVNTATIAPSYDVVTTLTGPVSQAGNAVAAVSGDLVTYTVKTTNSSAAASTAPNVVQTVSFDGDLTGSGIYVSNNGTYAYISATNKTVVTFPALTTLAVGQSVVNTISFVAPSAAYNATAVVAANTSGSNTGDTNTANNTTSLTTNVKAAAGNSANVYTTINTNTTVATPGQTVRLTVTTGNNGPSTANNAVQQVMLAAGLTNVSFPNGNGSYNATTGIVTFNTITSLASASTNPTAFLIDFTAPATGPVLATASVSLDNPDPVAADNVAQVKVDIISATDVATLIEGPTTATVGQAVTYSVVTANNSANTAYGVVQTVQLPAGLGAGNVTFSGNTTGTYNNATGIASFTFADPLTAGVRETNTITFSVPASAVNDPAASSSTSNRLTVAASVRTSTSESTVINNSASVATTIMPTTDVSVSVSGPSAATIGNAATYTVTTINNGPSVAAFVTPSLQLPAGLTNNGGIVLITGAGTATANYNNATGLVTFPTLTNLAAGASVSNTITVTMPDVTELTPVAQVQVGAATYDSNLDNNRGQVVTMPINATTATADLATSISITLGGTTPTPGTTVRLTANFSNATAGSTVSSAVLRVALPAGLNTSSGSVVVSNGGSYDNATGIVSWSTSTLANGTPLAYTIDFRAPVSGSVTATSYVTSSTSDATLTNNVNSTTLTVTSQTDVTTTVTGPATAMPGARVTYAVATVNNGPSPASNPVTQTVAVPAGVTNLAYPAGSSISSTATTTTITFPTITAQAVGTVMNYVSFDAPTTSFGVTGNVSMTGDLVTTNNSSSVNTTVNQVPVAYDVVNTQQSPQGSSSGALRISPLVATDADVSNTLTYRITALPNASTGVLTLGGTTPITLSTVLQTADLTNIYFNPIGTGTPTDPSYVGNTFFSYTATDNFGAVSSPALYTIQIGKDFASTYTAEKVKGGATGAYQNGDVITNAFDINSATYNNSLTLTNNGIRSATADATGANTLSGLGLSLNATTGQITVSNRLLLRTGTYTVNITTVDAQGGTNTLAVPFTIGSSPLPVELTAFTATAKLNDAVLAWTTASEKNNDHFVVERSVDGKEFTTVGKVAGNGTSNEVHTYSFVDKAAARLGQVVYYRLRQVDTDSTESFSPVRTVQFSATTEVALGLYPNPAAEQTTLDLTQVPAGNYSVTLLDQAGRVISTQELAGGATHTLNVDNLPVGSYIVTVNGQSLHLSKRLLKQ